jgi:hypothetical protein
MSGVIIDSRTGPVINSDGPGNQPLRQGRTAALVTADVWARYYEAVSRGNVYYLATGAASPTAFTGGAAGTPLIGVYNPTGSGVNLCVLATGFALTTVPTAAGVVVPELYSGVSALPTGTATAPTNALSQQATGSKAKGFVNTAMTGSTAINLALPFAPFWWATAAAGAMAGPGLVFVDGLAVFSPGVLGALGIRTLPTGTVADALVIWEEIPI